MDDDSYEVGYREDGVFWVTASRSVPDAAAAERYMGTPWRVVADVFVGPTGVRLNTKDEQWAECEPDAPEARRGWRLVHTGSPEIFDGDEWVPNPHYRPDASEG